MSDLTMEQRSALHSALAASHTVVSGWQPIETAPRDGTLIWAFWPVHTRDDQQKTTCWDNSMSDDPRWVDHADSIDWCQPTHWMPLPPAPDAA